MSWTHERARVAALSYAVSAGKRQPDDPELAEARAALIEARRGLRAEQLAEHVRKVLAIAPPLSDEQKERIAALLRVGAS
jgi:hypothetical protein